MSTRPRILLTNFHPRFSGGHASSIMRITTSWLAEHFDFAVAVPGASDIFARCNEAGVRAFACDYPGKVSEIADIITNILNFRRIVREFSPCIIHCNGGADLKIASWSYPFTRTLRFVRHHRAVKGLGNDPYHRWLYGRRVAANIYVSHGAMTLCHQQGMAPPSACQVIYNGIDTAHFAPRPCDAELRRSLGIGPTEFVFGSCAGLGNYKRIDLMIRSAHVLKDHYAFKILVLGADELFPKLAALAQELGVADRLIYGGRHVDVRPYIACFDSGFVLSDRIETLSNAAREMLSMGKPLISSAYTGLTENFIDGKQGIFVTPGDLDTLVSAIKSMLTMPAEQRRIMAESARTHAVAYFDRKVTALPLQQLYNKLAAEVGW